MRNNYAVKAVEQTKRNFVTDPKIHFSLESRTQVFSCIFVQQVDLYKGESSEAFPPLPPLICKILLK